MFGNARLTRLAKLAEAHLNKAILDGSLRRAQRAARLWEAVCAKAVTSMRAIKESSGS
jgi:hypothetical protein